MNTNEAPKNGAEIQRLQSEIQRLQSEIRRLKIENDTFRWVIDCVGGMPPTQKGCRIISINQKR